MISSKRRKMTRGAVLAACLAGLMLAGMTTAAQGKPKLGLMKLAEVEQPTALASPPGYPKLIVVTGRTGELRIIRGNRLLRKPLLDLSRKTDPFFIEEGLLGLAFPPDFKRTGRFYVDYTAKNGDLLVVEYRTVRGRPAKLVPDSRRLILRIRQIQKLGGHNGGYLAFRSDQLYIAVGDGNNPGDAANKAQDPRSLRGKILRIVPRPDPDTGRPYQVPAGNPYVGIRGRNEVFAIGLRNPHRFAFHRSDTGQDMMAIYDVGQGRYEELNYLPVSEALGANFGWHDYEGFKPYNCGEKLCPNGGKPTVTEGLSWPQLVYTHDVGCAIIGGPVIGDPTLTSVKGRFIYGDFCTNRIRTAAPLTPTITDDQPAGFVMPPGKGRHPALNGFGVDGFKRVYAFSNFGPIYRVVQR